ncbi:MAG: 2-amino-4-hydroxy-6-hydroxymethyldihydropteridine diphosphokinase [Prevotella sp.]
MTHKVIIALGSNVSKDNLALCRPLLDEYMKVDRASSVITTEAIGMQSPPFANQLIGGITCKTLDELTRLTKDTESALGRKRGTGIVSIDIDILQYDDVRLHLHDWEREYVKQLYCQIQK